MILAVHQGPSTADTVDVLAAQARRAARQGARLLVCPEMYATGYNIGDEVFRAAEPADGPTARALARIASETGVALCYGYPERDGARVYNAVQLIDRYGGRVAGYRKTHLFGELDRFAFTAGETAVVQAELDGLTLGLLVCYDVEFPEIVRAHALAGTELLLVPTALMRPHELVAEMLVPVRAYESQMFVCYANHSGGEGALRYCGRSCVVSPTGAVLTRAGDEEDLLITRVDPEVLHTARTRNTYLADRRADLY